METGKRSSFDRLSQLLTTRRIESTAIELAVRPVPAQFPRDATWLPARRLRLHDDWEPAHDLAHVGAPLSRTVHLWADGLVAAQLPEIGVAAPSGVKVYPDQPQISERETPAGFTAVHQEKYALIARTPGVIQFPTLELPWWNTQSDQLEYARIRARTFTVRAPAHANASPPPVAAETATAKRDDAATAPPMRKHVWFWATQALLGAWLVTCLLWWRDRRRRWPRAAGSTTGTDSEPTSSGAMRELRRACRMNDARAARDALLHWSAAQAPGHGPVARSLRGLCASADPILAAQILVLEGHLYGADGERWVGQKLWLAFAEFRSRPPPAAAMTVPARPLPHLFKLANK